MLARQNISTAQGKPSGVAGRAANYSHLRQIAKTFVGISTTRCQIQTAIAYGTADLSWPARSLLLLLVSHLSPIDIAQGKSTVWPSTLQIAAAFGCSERAVRTYKAELEAAGYLLRRYDRRNRPLRHAAFDLAPFLARLPEILAAIDNAAARRRQQRLFQHSERDAEPHASLPPMAAETSHPINNQNPTSESVTVGPHAQERGMETVLEVIQRSSKLRGALSAHAWDTLNAGQPDHAMREIGQQIDTLLSTLSTDLTRRNNRSTWTWATRRYGVAAITMLGVAIDDPNVHCPARFFGWLATTSENIDLTANLERIRQRSSAPPSEASPPAFPELQRMLGHERYQAWFSATRLVMRGTDAVILAPTAFVAEWIRNNFCTELRLLAKKRRYSNIQVEVDPSVPSDTAPVDI